MNLTTFMLPAGTVCKRNGIPFELAADTEIRCHPDNWSLIRDDFAPEVDGQVFCRSQSMQFCGNPNVAHEDATSSITSNSSLRSSAGDNKSLT